MGKWYVTILTVFVVVFAYHPTFAQGDTLTITSFPYTGTPPDGITSMTLPVDGGWSLSGDNYRHEAFSTSTSIAVVRTLATINLDEGIYPQSITVPVLSDSNWGACDSVIKSVIHVFFYNASNALLYNNGNGRTYDIQTSVTAGVEQTINVDFSSINAHGQSFTLSTLNPAKISIGVGFSCLNIGSFGVVKQVWSVVSGLSFDYDTDIIELVRPLTSTHETSLTMPQDPPYYANYVMTVSDEAGRPVHAPIDSTVMGITKLTAVHCDMLGLYECYANEYPIDISRAYLVSLRTNDGEELLYIVDNAPNYLQLDANITGGCVMGQTTRTNSPVGLAVATDGTEDLLPRFTLAPSDDAEPCVSGETNLVCEGGESRLNTIFIVSQKSAGVVMDGSAIIVPPGGRMNGLLALPMNERVYVEVVAGGESAIVQFGTRVENVEFTEQLNTIAFGWSYVVPDVGNNSTVSLTNTGAIPLTISDICVAFESKNDPNDPENPNPPPLPPQPTNCYFFNLSFDLGDSGWQIDETGRKDPT